MKTLRFKNEYETADMVIRLEMACSRFTVTGRTEIMVEDNEPALVLPPTFVALLRSALRKNGIDLYGVVRTRRVAYRILTSEGTVQMSGSFCVASVINELVG